MSNARVFRRFWLVFIAEELFMLNGNGSNLGDSESDLDICEDFLDIR